MAVKYFSKPIFLATIICIIFFYSFKNLFIEKESVHSLLPLNEISFVQGKISSSPVKTGNEKWYCCNFTPTIVGNNQGIKSSAKGNFKLYIPAEIVEAYFPGKLFSSVKKTSQLSKSSLNSSNKNENKELYLFETGGFYSFTGSNIENGFFANKCLASNWKNNLIGKIDYFRALCRVHFKRLMYGWGEGGGLLLALLSGAKEYTKAETAIAFKNAGLSHILALSGMHLSMFSAIAMFLGKKIGRKKLSFIIRIISLIIFCWFAGFSPSLLRAFICALLLVVAAMAGVKQPDMIMILCFSFLFQSMISPGDLYNVGFMLSYGALAGLLLTGRLFYIILIKIIPSWLSSSLSASIGAQIFTAPITLKLFGTFCPIGIFATSVVSPLITIFIYSGLFLIIITLIFPGIQYASGFLINFQYNIIKNIVIFFSRAPIYGV